MDRLSFTGFCAYKTELFFEAGFETSGSELWKLSDPTFRVETFKGQTMKLFPNPCSDFLNLEMFGQGSSNTIQIFSSDGKLCHHISNCTEEKVQVPVSELSPGMYTMVISGEEHISTYKFIKQ